MLIVKSFSHAHYNEHITSYLFAKYMSIFSRDHWKVVE